MLTFIVDYMYRHEIQFLSYLILAFYNKRKGVVHRIIDEHDDHHDDYQDFNFFGNEYGGGHHQQDYHNDYHSDYHNDYHGDDHDYGHDYDHYDDHYDEHYDDHDDHGTLHDYVHEDSHGRGGRGGYGKKSYKPVQNKHGYKRIYKPKVIIIKKIVPISTTTMPSG